MVLTEGQRACATAHHAITARTFVSELDAGPSSVAKSGPSPAQTSCAKVRSKRPHCSMIWFVTRYVRPCSASVLTRPQRRGDESERSCEAKARPDALQLPDRALHRRHQSIAQHPPRAVDSTTKRSGSRSRRARPRCCPPLSLLPAPMIRRIVGSRHNLVRRGERERGGTGILFEEPNPTGSRPRDLIGLCRTRKRRPQPWHGNGTGIPRLFKRETEHQCLRQPIRKRVSRSPWTRSVAWAAPVRLDSLTEIPVSPFCHCCIDNALLVLP